MSILAPRSQCILVDYKGDFMKALSSVLLLCVTVFGLSVHAVQADCPLKNLRKSGQTPLSRGTNYYDVVQQQSAGSSNAVSQVNTSN